MIRRWRQWGAVATSLTGLITLLLPSLLTMTGLVPVWLNACLSRDTLCVQCDRVSLHWWAPAVVSQLSLSTSDGVILAEISHLQSEALLCGLLWSPGNRRNWSAVGGTFHLESRPGGSNWEDLATSMVAPPVSHASAGTPNFSLRFAEVQLLFSGAGHAASTPLRLEELHLQQVPQGWLLRGNGGVEDGSLGIKMQVQQTADLASTAMDVSLDLVSFPLSAWQAGLTRLAAPVRLEQGLCTGHVKFQGQRSAWMTEGNLEIHAAQGTRGARCVPWTLPSATIDWGVAQTAGQLHANAQIAHPTWGEANLEAQLPLPKTHTAAAWQHCFSRCSLLSRGSVDLAAFSLAGSPLPDHEVTACEAHWRVEVRQTPDAAHGEAEWGVEVLNAKTLASSVRLAEPLRGQMQVQWQHPFDFHLEEVSLAGAGITLQGGGDVRRGELAVDLDAAKFLQQFEASAKPVPPSFAGRFQGQVTWQQLVPHGLRVTTEGTCQDVVLWSGEGQNVWSEPRVRIRGTSHWKHAQEAFAFLESGALSLQLGRERIALTLPPRVRSSRLLPLEMEMHAVDIAKWLARARAWCDVPDIVLGGELHARGQLQLGRNTFQVSELDGDVQDFSCEAGQQMWKLRSVHVAVRDADWRPSGMFSAGQMTLVSPLLSGVIQELHYHSAMGEVVGRGGLRADLTQLRREQGGPTLGGDLIAQFWLQGSAGVITYGVEANVEAFAGNVADIRWYEPSLQLSSRGVWHLARGQVEVAQAMLQGKRLSTTFGGLVDVYPVHLNVAGDVDADWTWWCEQAGTPLVQIQSPGPRRFRVRGPIAQVAMIDAEYEAGWSGAAIGGVSLGPSSFRLMLSEGTVRATPIRAATGEGYVQVVPTLDWSDPAGRVEISPGRIAHRVPIRPEVTRQWLKYAAPLLSDLTRCEAEFSVELTKGSVPYRDPRDAELEGHLLLHQGSVGPGPNVTQLMELANQIKRWSSPGQGERITDSSRMWIVLPEQRVPVRVHGGRVHHAGLAMTIDGMTIYSTGAVDLRSEAIDLVLTLPFDVGRLANLGLPAGTPPQTLRVPVRGTLSSPRWDHRAWGNLVSGFSQQAAQGYLQQQLQRRLPESLQEALGDDRRSIEQAVERALGEQLRRLFD